MAATRKPATWRRVTVAVPYLWLLVFFLMPFLEVARISLVDPAMLVEIEADAIIGDD